MSHEANTRLNEVRLESRTESGHCSGEMAWRLKENYESMYGYANCQAFRWWAMKHLTAAQARTLILLSGGFYGENHAPDYAAFQAKAEQLGWTNFEMHL